VERVYVSSYTGRLPVHVRRLEEVTGAVADWMKLPPGAMPEIALAPDDDATILYTSGTTGTPKGAVGSHRNIIFNIFAIGFSNARNFIRRGERPPVPDPLSDPQRATLLSVPFFHVTGCFAFLIPVIATGGKLVLMRKFDAEKALALIAREKIAIVGGVPAIAWQILEHPARASHDLSSLDTVSYGGAPSAPDLVERIKREFPASLPGNGWGMTETSAICTAHAGEDYEHRPQSAGPALPVCDLRIVGEDGKTLPPGAVGELWARGPNVVRGYWDRPEETRAAFIDGWVRTGDLATLDDEGFLTIVDRAKDMLIRGGENIYCIEVENVLYDHPSVMDVGIVGLPHRTLGEEPAAVVTLKPGYSATEKELKAFVADRLAAFKVPVKILFSKDTLPRNANGKIMKPELKKMFEEEKAKA
jgi:long-chain acyl-CoA synthetase